MTNDSLLSAGITFTLLLLILTYVNVYMVFILRKKRYEYYEEKQRWTNLVVEERDRLMAEIEREIHDNLGQLIFLLHKTYQRMFKDIDREEHLRLRQSASDLIVELSRHVRNINNTLNSDYIHAKGLEEVLRRDVEQVVSSGWEDCQMEVTGTAPEKIDPDKELMIYRITQEAMHNALKHAGATVLILKLHFLPEKTLITVMDNGRGFDVERAGEKGGIGLKNMAHRAACLNAKLKLDTSPGNGTTVILNVPV